MDPEHATPRSQHVANLLTGTFLLLFAVGVAVFMLWLDYQARGTRRAVGAFYAGIITSVVVFSGSRHVLRRLRWLGEGHELGAGRPARLLAGLLGGAAGGSAAAVIGQAPIAKYSTGGAVAAGVVLLLLWMAERLALRPSGPA